MKSTIIGITLALSMTAFSVSAQDVDLERVDLFVSLITEAGCNMNEQVAGEVLPANGFTDRDETKAIVGYLMGEGLAEVGDGVLKLITPDCADTLTPMEQLEGEMVVLEGDFLAYMATRECTMTYAESRSALPEAGFDLGRVDQIIEKLMNDGTITVGSPNQTLTVNPEFCS